MNEIFSSIYTRLTSQLTENVYDHVPQDLASSNYPFVRLDAINPVDSGTDTETGFTASVQVVGFSQYEGTKEINNLSDDVYNALHRWAMPNTATYGVSGIREVLRTTAVNPDGLTRNSVQRYEIIFEPLPL